LDLAPVQISGFMDTHLAGTLLVLLTEAEPLSSTDSSAKTLKDAESAHLLCEEAAGGLKMTEANHCWSVWLFFLQTSQAC